MTLNGNLNRKLRMGLVGGGRGAFIGRVHVTAAILDNRCELVAGALSSDPQVCRESAPEFGISPERAYASYEEMITAEAQLPEGERIDFVSIATPNHTHFDIAQKAVEAGFNVMCDKPMTFDLAQAEQLLSLVEEKGVVFGVTYTYTGYPLVRQAREMALAGELGEVQVIRSAYLQGWLRTRIEEEGQKQASWRTDPAQSGAAGAFGDLGTHAFNLGRYITGLSPQDISCQLKTFETGRQLDDYGHAMLHFQNGALGSVVASQVSHGRENDLSIEIDGTKASLHWRQEEPNRLTILENGQPSKLYTRNPGAGYMTETANAACRIPSGHPEGYFEAFANVYRSAFDDMARRATGDSVETKDTIYTNAYDGTEGMFFIQQSVASSLENGAWLPAQHRAARR